MSLAAIHPLNLDWRHSGEGCEISVILRGKTSRLSIVMLRGSRTRSQASSAELVQLKVDVLVVGFLPAIHAAKQATKTIPIVMVTHCRSSRKRDSR